MCATPMLLARTVARTPARCPAALHMHHRSYSLSCGRLAGGREHAEGPTPTGLQQRSGAWGRRAQAFVSLNWVLSGEPLDLETELGLDFLDYLLVGTSAAPLRKVRAPASYRHPAITAPASKSDTCAGPGSRCSALRRGALMMSQRGSSLSDGRGGGGVVSRGGAGVQALMDSGLGEALVGGGLQGDLRQPVFSIGLKGADSDNFQKVPLCHHLSDHGSTSRLAKVTRLRRREF